jgi:hypothetical protein
VVTFCGQLFELCPPVSKRRFIGAFHVIQILRHV